MTKHKTGTREEWLAARMELLPGLPLHVRSGLLLRHRSFLLSFFFDIKYKT